jgi:hypothetical protein
VIGITLLTTGCLGATAVPSSVRSATSSGVVAETTAADARRMLLVRRNEYLLAPVTIDGRPAGEFMVDTGAVSCAGTLSVADALAENGEAGRAARGQPPGRRGQAGRGTITQIIDAAGDGMHALTLAGVVATDPGGNVYVGGYVSNNAFRIAPGGAITQIIDAAGDGVHPLATTLGVAADAEGTAYVTGFDSDNVFRITPGGIITQILDATGDGTHPFSRPTDVATDIGGNVYVAAHDTSYRTGGDDHTDHRCLWRRHAPVRRRDQRRGESAGRCDHRSRRSTRSSP